MRDGSHFEISALAFLLRRSVLLSLPVRVRASLFVCLFVLSFCMGVRVFVVHRGSEFRGRPPTTFGSRCPPVHHMSKLFAFLPLALLMHAFGVALADVRSLREHIPDLPAQGGGDPPGMFERKTQAPMVWCAFAGGRLRITMFVVMLSQGYT